MRDRPTWTLRLCRVFLALVSPIVPSGLRRDWQAEWDGEFAYRSEAADQHAPLTRLALLSRCSGALIHAAWLRKEDIRMETILHDVRFALRLARRERAFTAVAVLTLALGIGANAALFTVLNGTLLQPLPFRDPDRLVVAWETVPSQDIDRNTPAPATLDDWRARARTVQSLTPMTTAIENITGDGEPERLLLLRASADLLPTLGIRPALGRSFHPDEDRAGGPRVILLSDDLWSRRYARDPAVLGRTIKLDGEPTTVVGVLPANLPLPVLGKVDGWIPLALRPDEAHSESRMLWVFARLAAGATPAAADAELSALLRSRTHGAVGDIGARVEPIDEAVRGDVRPDLMLAFVATAIVLLIACGNVAIMLLARSVARQRELAVRGAVGASRGRILRQLVVESLLLALAGAIAGAIFGLWTLRGLAALIPASLSDEIVPRLDWHVVWFVGGVSIATVLLFGVVPALASLRRETPGSLAIGARSTDRGGVRTARATLVVVEVALTLVLLSAAALLGRTFVALMGVDLGFDPESVLTMQVPRVERAGAPPDRHLAFYRALETRLAALPGVRAVGLTNGLPVRFTGGGSGFFPEGAGKDGSIAGNHRIVNGGYFAALRIPLLAGRTFAQSDLRDRPIVALVSRSFADRAWPHRDPLGRRFTWGAPAQDNPWITVVGVVGDVRLARTLAPTPHVYLAFTQVPEYVTSDIAVRVDGDPLAIAGAVRAAIHDIDPDQPVANIAPYDRLLAESVGRRRFTLLLMIVFASLALLLAAVGLYGVVAFFVSRRTHEIGVRVALGATAIRVRGRVLRDGLLLVMVGVASGIALSIVATRWVAAWVPGVGQLDGLSIAVSTGMVLLTAAVACDIPARRASRIDPITALRVE